MNKYLKNSFIEDIYDYVKETALSDKQNDEWAKLSRHFAKESRQNLHNYLRNKNIEFDPLKSEIHIGEHIILKFIEK